MTEGGNGDLQLIRKFVVFDGEQRFYSHKSGVLGTSMNFGVYIPPGLKEGERRPALFCLAGLTCTEENFVIKSGFQRYAAKHRILVITPDTSPRGLNLPGEKDSWDFGEGAGFYLDAVKEPFDKNYKMFSYITDELPTLVDKHFPALSNRYGITGHSMGGHGAIIAALKKPDLFSSVSAFAPICHPSHCPWGQKAFTGYLGSNKVMWSDYDATALVLVYKGPPVEILIDQGTDDQFYKDQQLLPKDLEIAAAKNDKVKIILNMREQYDHSYYFIQTFIESHFDHHARILLKGLENN